MSVPYSITKICIEKGLSLCIEKGIMSVPYSITKICIEKGLRLCIEKGLKICIEKGLKNSLRNVKNPSQKKKVFYSVNQQSNVILQGSRFKSLQSLLHTIYISCQIRDGDLETFFAHENQATRPSLSLGGKIRPSAKSDLFHNCLELHEKQLLQAPNVA